MSAHFTAAENTYIRTVLMTLGFALGQSAPYFCCSTPGQDITDTHTCTYCIYVCTSYIFVFIAIFLILVNVHKCMHVYIRMQSIQILCMYYLSSNIYICTYVQYIWCGQIKEKLCKYLV